MLSFLDQVGKFSLFDPLLFTMFLGGFRLAWKGTCNGSNCGLVLQAVPQIGFYFLFLGTVLSLVIGETMLWCDRESQALRARYISKASSRQASSASTPGGVLSVFRSRSNSGVHLSSASPFARSSLNASRTSVDNL